MVEAEKEYKAAQKAVEKATCELNKRIYEHDNAASMGFDKPEITLQVSQKSLYKLPIPTWSTAASTYLPSPLFYKLHKLSF